MHNLSSYFLFVITSSTSKNILFTLFIVYNILAMINLRNDYSSIASKDVLQHLLKKADKKYVGYGLDNETKKLNQLVKLKCQKDVDSYVLSGGTITNVIALNKMLTNPYDAIMCVPTSHINVHESGAIESSGHKIIYLPNINGKIDISKIEETYSSFIDFHMVKPRVIYLSNSTELGEVYSLNELKKIYSIAKKLKMYLFIDGARLPQALVKGNYTLKDIASTCDMFYLGGTKLGLPYGELLIIVNDELKKDFKYLLKNKLGLLSKGFVGAIMFNYYLENDYYLSLAKNSQNQMKKLVKELKDLLVYPVETNQAFLSLSNIAINKIKNKIDFEIWEKNSKSSIIRLVTSFDTTNEDVTSCIKIIKSVA